MSNVIQLVDFQAEPRVDTRAIAESLGLKHQTVFEMVKDYRSDFERLGLLRFETGKPPKGGKGGRPERSALLNENQCYLLLAFSRNTSTVRTLKVELVKAFGEARRRGDAARLSLIEQLMVLEIKDKASHVKARLGSRLMLERKEALKELRPHRAALEDQLQPRLIG